MSDTPAARLPDGPDPTPTPAQRDACAAEAARSVTALFGGRFLGIPFTHLAHTAHPAPPFVGGSWNYWWQAHYLDAIVDAGLRALRRGELNAAKAHARTGHRLVGTIRLRNLARFTNLLYDDMAWLALAVDRLRLLRAAIDESRPTRRMRTAERVLTAQLRSAMTDDLGGGLFWSTKRDFKNVPATGPAALHLARLGDTGDARRLVDWLYDRLRDAETGLFIDGIRIEGGAERVITDVYTYNQGTVLGVLVTLGDETNLARARELVAAVADRLTVDDGERRPLSTHGGDDGGLFTGILVRYLALAATAPTFGAETTSLARRLVLDTADAVWADRRDRLSDKGVRATVFPAAFGAHARAHELEAHPEPLELSTQVQAWMILEAAAVVAATPA